MPRARNIKPSLFKNEVLGEADPLLTILFTGLWCLADREGRMEDRPKRIKAEIFPYRDIPDFNGYLTVLEQLGFITRYSVGGCAFIQVENFTKHQSPHKTERASEIPEKPKDTGGCEGTRKAPLDNGGPSVKEPLIPDSGLPDSSNTDTPPNPPKGDSVNYDSWPELPDDQILKDWLASRKKLKASNSQTAMNRIGKELQKANEIGLSVNDCLSECVTRGWKGFKAEWMTNAGYKPAYPASQQGDYNGDGWAEGFDPLADPFDDILNGS